MFDDPQTVLGMVIGILIVLGGTTFGVLEHRRREREAARHGGPL